MATEPLPLLTLKPSLLALFGTGNQPMLELELERRATELFPGVPVVRWEGDPTSFEFSYVSPAAVALLGWPRERWTKEATFWADHVVHRDDRDSAIAYCALATAKCCDHVFEYRASTPDGRVVWLRDFVRVTVGQRRVPVLLRGAMFDITQEREAAGIPDTAPAQREPSPDLLLAV